MSQNLKVIFAGTPAFAATILAAIHAAGFAVPLVLTQPDRPAGRGMKLTASPVKQFALEQGLAVIQPASLRTDGKFPLEAAAALDRLHSIPHEVMVVAAYGLLLPQTVLDIARHGCLNAHASLLPRWRGAAPIQRALAAGDTQTGITLMQMDAGLDTGPMLSRAQIPISPADTAATLHDKLASLGAQLIVEELRLLAEQGKLLATPQPVEGVTYAQKISKHEARLNWQLPAKRLACQVRAFDPFPGTFAMLGDEPLKIWEAAPVAAHKVAMPGEIIEITANAVTIACGADALRVTQWQKPGGKRLPVGEFLKGFTLREGQCFVV